METVLRIENLSVFYDGNKVIQDVNLSFKEGELVCLMGHSDFARTVLLRSFVLLNEDVSRKYRTTGKIIYRGEVVEKGKVGFLRNRISYFGKDIFTTMDDLSMRELIVLMIGRRKMNNGGFGFELSTLLNELDILSDLPDGMNSRLKNLSDDTKVLFLLSLSILKNSDVIIFDGVLDGLKEKTFENLVRFFENVKGKTFLISTRNSRRFVGISDRVVIVENGKIIFDGDPKHIIINWGRSNWKFSRLP